MCLPLKKDGYIFLGLYNRYGRIRTIIRKYLYKIFGKKILFILDPVLRKTPKDSKGKIDAWIKDQYLHPVESLHTFDEALSWFKDNNIEFINSIPSCNFDDYDDYENIFQKTSVGSFFSRLFNQFSMIFNKLGSDGGLFVVIGKKNESN